MRAKRGGRKSVCVLIRGQTGYCAECANLPEARAHNLGF